MGPAKLFYSSPKFKLKLAESPKVPIKTHAIGKNFIHVDA